jgi:hypothetical protein
MLFEKYNRRDFLNLVTFILVSLVVAAYVTGESSRGRFNERLELVVQYVLPPLVHDPYSDSNSYRDQRLREFSHDLGVYLNSMDASSSWKIVEHRYPSKISLFVRVAKPNIDKVSHGIKEYLDRAGKYMMTKELNKCARIVETAERLGDGSTVKYSKNMCIKMRRDNIPMAPEVMVRQYQDYKSTIRGVFFISFLGALGFMLLVTSILGRTFHGLR